MKASFRLSIVMLFSLTSGIAGAQQTAAPFTAGAVRAIGGFTSVNFDDLNARLVRAGLPGVSADVATAGLGSDVRFGRLILSGAWQSMLSRDQATPAYKSRFSGNVALLDASWVVASHEGASFYPIVGIGGAQTAIAIDRRGDFAFDDALAHPDRGIRMKGSALLYHVGVGGEQRFNAFGKPAALTIRGGVMRNMGEQDWSSEWQSVSEGPKQFRGGYAQVAIATPLPGFRDALLPMAGAALRIVQR